MMMDISYIIAKILCRFSLNRREFMSGHFRRCGITVGERCNICSNIRSSESYLITLGNDVTISTEVLFINHDASVGKIFGKTNASDICGKITIGNNCFIGARSILLYGITLADDIIVAAGSVVTKSFLNSRIILAGNPARIIGTWDVMENKYADKTYRLHGLKGKKAKEIILGSQNKLIVR